MPNTPLISVIIPTYNSALYLERCLDSVINQSVKDIEIIAVDDQSDDNTIELLTKYSDTYEYLKFLETSKKEMAGGARNLGLKKSTGKYISFIDSDDWIDLDYYYYLVRSIEKANSEIALCGVRREYHHARNSSVRYKYNTQNVVEGRFALNLLSRMVDQDVSISAIVCNKLFRASFLKSHSLTFIENCFNEDDIFMFNALLEARLVSITNKTNYHLFQRKNSASRGFTKKHIDDLFFAFVEIRKLLESRSQFEEFKNLYYSFFEKCLSYLIESLRFSEQDDEKIDEYFRYAFSISKDSISLDEFIDYCGHQRIERFFVPKLRNA